MRSEVALDLAEFSRVDCRKVQNTRQVRNTKTIQTVIPVTNTKTVKNTRAAQANRIARQRIRRRRQRIRAIQKSIITIFFVSLAGMCLYFLCGSLFGKKHADPTIKNVSIQEDAVSLWEKNKMPHPAWTEDWLTVNEYSRPGTPLKEVNDIFVHYTANKGTNARQNRSYFEQLKDTHERSASAHFIIGYEGDIVQCIPLSEMAYAVKSRNEDSISIECCFVSDDGSFTKETYDSLIALLTWLMQEYNLTTDHILRHYDCGGKKCPIYYTENEDEWEQLKADVDKKLNDL